MKVFILATCRHENLLPYTLLVFRTIRTGFATASINVIGNHLPDYADKKVAEACEATQCVFENQTATIHHEWVRWLAENQREPFWICDTDIVLYGQVEGWQFSTSIAGARSPEWEDAHGNITRSRLHGSLMFINPVLLREQLTPYFSSKPLTPFMPPANPFYPILIPLNGRLYFYDTCSVLYHMIGGTAFSDEQRDAYFHFNFGTIPDLTLPLLDNPEAILKRRAWIMEDTQRGRGLWREGEEYFAARVPRYDGKDVIAPVLKEDARDAGQWATELCKSNQAAMAFCGSWYSLCHAWDDLVDTMIDGRPTMSKDQMISEIGVKSAILYNSPFYVANKELLFPIILDITSTWRVSVAWEKSSILHRRLIADVFRTCGNRLYYFVALLCGGEQHAQDMILKIHERDWLGQHDEHGRPT